MANRSEHLTGDSPREQREAPSRTTIKDQALAIEQAAKQFSAEDSYSPIAWRKFLAPHGTLAIDLPRRCGGFEWNMVDCAKIAEICGRYDLDLRDVPGLGHAKLVTHTKSQRYDWLIGKVARGEAFTAIAITEEGGGSDIRSLTTTASPKGARYIISGRKRHVSRVLEATHLIVFAQVLRDENKLTAFVLPRDTEGVSWIPLHPMGLAGVSWCELVLDQVVACPEHRIGGEGEGGSLFVNHFTQWRIMMAAAALGCAEVALEQTISWLQQRSCFGGPVGRFSHLQQQLAEHTSQLFMVKLLIENTARRIDIKLPAVADAAMCKAEAVEIAIRTVQFCMLAHGASGYNKAMRFEKRLRDLLGLRIADGTVDVLRGQVAQSVLGNELYNESLGRDQKRDWSSIQTRRYW